MSKTAVKRDAGVARDLLFMSTPSLWPDWPMLPLVRRRADGRRDLGMMYDSGDAPSPSCEAKVRLCNLFLLPRRLEDFLALPGEAFGTFEEVVAAGWRVD